MSNTSMEGRDQLLNATTTITAVWTGMDFSPSFTAGTTLFGNQNRSLMFLLTVVNTCICIIAIITNCWALRYLNYLRVRGDACRATTVVLACLTLVDLTRGVTDSEFLLFYLFVDSNALIIENWCPMFALTECLPAITLSIALFLAILKSAVMVVPFRIKRYLTNKNTCFILFVIFVSKILYTGVRIQMYGVTFNRFSVECMINDHYSTIQVYTSFVLNYELVLIFLVIATIFIVYNQNRAGSQMRPPNEAQRVTMIRCAVFIISTCIGCYSIFIAWRMIQVHNITLPPVLFYNLKYIKLSADHILLNFNAAINPLMYIINNHSIKTKLSKIQRHRVVAGQLSRPAINHLVTK